MSEQQPDKIMNYKAALSRFFYNKEVYDTNW